MYPWKPPVVESVCWTRMQAESGQGLATIVARKEMERRSGGGLFLWGVGNAPARAIPLLAKMGAPIGVVFSVMKSRPKAIDSSPAAIVAWRRWVDPDGAVRDLPHHVLVTSRAGSRDHHYALMCRSDSPLAVDDGGPFDHTAYRNFGGGRPVGASQTTALLERRAPDGEADYRVAMRARLTGGLWVRLVDPVPVPTGVRALLDEVPGNVRDWRDLVSSVRSGGVGHPVRPVVAQESLFAL